MKTPHIQSSSDPDPIQKLYTCPKCQDQRPLKEIMALAGKLGGATKGASKVRGDKAYYQKIRAVGIKNAEMRKHPLHTFSLKDVTDAARTAKGLPPLSPSQNQSSTTPLK